MHKAILEITLTMEGPLLSQSTDPDGFEMDAVVARNHKGEPYIPGTLVSGKLRQAWEELSGAATQDVKWFQPEIDQWLGKSNQHGFPLTKHLVFTDFVLKPQQNSLITTPRKRIKIDQDRGAVDKHQLVIIENPFVSGEEYHFIGKLHFFSPSTIGTDNIIQHITAGIQWFSQLGSLRTIGFGHVVNAEITDIRKNPLKQVTKPNFDVVRVGLQIDPEYPFCIPGKTLANNLFESKGIIPGAAILGSIATTINHLTGQQGNKIANINDSNYDALIRNFNKLRITHAFPGNHNKRPVVAPLSLVRVAKDKIYYDVSQVSQPCLIHEKAPDFAVDWKDQKNTLKEYPWPYIRMENWGWESLNFELRVRTAIDRKKLRSAENELFAYEQIIPDNKHWYAELDLSRIDEKERGYVLAHLQSLTSQGIIGLGKTKTPVKLTFTNEIAPVFAVDNSNPVGTKQWVITLQTDMLLGSPERLDETSGAEELKEMYLETWQELSDNILTMTRYFARQKLSGGRHRYKIFKQDTNDYLYRPWLLTEAGSVFVLEANDNQVDVAQNLIKKWQEQGVPISRSACSYYRINSDPEKQWQYTPFIPQNGYGEIAVNISGAPVKTLRDNDGCVSLIEKVSVKKENA